jgi:hypothetical protein
VQRLYPQKQERKNCLTAPSGKHPKKITTRARVPCLVTRLRFLLSAFALKKVEGRS